MVLVLFPFLFFILSTILFHKLWPSDLRETFLKSFLVVSLWMWISTELLSIFDSITRWGLFSAWLGGILLVIVLLVLFKRRGSFPMDPQANLPNKRGSLLLPVPITVALLLLIVGGITCYIAITAPPNNYDSMTYHMARIPHWIQNRNIQYFPTATQRQNYSPPLTEFFILHLQLLSKSDQYANMIQWFAFLISILATTLIGKQLKFTSRGQWITAAISATLPMAILQNTSTQNDLVTSAFILGFGYSLLRAVNEKTWTWSTFAAISMGLALGTKGTAYIFCAGIGLGLGGLTLFGKTWQEIRGLSCRFAFIIALALTLNTGLYIRNWQLYRNPLVTSNHRTLVSKLSPQILFANLVRNTAMNLATPSDSINHALENSADALLGDQLNNPASTFEYTSFEITYGITEDDAGNGVHLILILISVLVLPWMRSKNKGDLHRFLLAVIISFLLYCLLLRWQPWGIRLLTPIFLLGSVLIGGLVDRLSNKDFLPVVIIIAVGLLSTPYLLLNRQRPLLPLWNDESVFYESSGERKILPQLNAYPRLDRDLDSLLSIFYSGESVVLSDRSELYFFSRREWYASYQSVCRFINADPARDIGLLMANNHWEYPFWVCIGQHASPGPRTIYHIAVDNVTGSLQTDPHQDPDLILVTQTRLQEYEILDGYKEVFYADPIRIYKPVQDN